MNLSINKLQNQHLQRKAVVYVRQSTPKQILHNQESTRRQYQLADKALELGWASLLITTIDEDLGLSGSSSLQRTGFQSLVASISLGEVGIILVTEVSRLSRLNSDWQRVLEICAIFQTLIADEDGLYDPRDPNDRLVLGLKGTLFAAELHLQQARMQGGLLNKARRGELSQRLPIGFVRNLDGMVVQDPNEQVRLTLQTIFAQFENLRGSRAVLRYFIKHNLFMPGHAEPNNVSSALVWRTPSFQMIQEVLHNPCGGYFTYPGIIGQLLLPNYRGGSICIFHSRLLQQSCI